MQNDKLNLAVEAINNNQVVGIPTETVYGIGVNPYSQEAVDKIFELKGRDEDKPLSILVSSYYDLHKLGIVSTIPEVVELYWPGPLTIVVETTEEFAGGVGTKNPCSISLKRNNILDFSLIFIKHADPFTYYIFSIFKNFIPHKIQILIRKALLKKTY